MDRATFTHIVKDAASKKRLKYGEFFRYIKLLESMDLYERSQLVDAIKEASFEPMDYIIKQGEVGDSFYLLIEGEAVATKVLPGQTHEEEVMHYKSGDYFGELALLNNEPRAANVIAKTNLKAAVLDRQSFKRLLGPIEDILKRNMANYVNFC